MTRIRHAALLSLMLAAACWEGTPELTGPVEEPASPAGIPVPQFAMMVEEVTPLPFMPGGTSSLARDINEHGQAVGSMEFSPGTNYATLWQNGAVQVLGSLGGDSHATGINSQGQIVGSSELNTGASRAFLWEDGVMQDLGVLGDPAINSSQAFDINERGQVVGLSTMGAGQVRGVIWENGVMTPLGTLGGPTSQAFAINELGQVVGLSQTSNGEVHAVLWENGVIQDLGTLGGVSSRATGINELGHVVGSALTSQGEVHAFLWKDNVMHDLGGTGIPPTSLALGMNDLGQVVGWGPWPLAWVSSDGTMFSLGNGQADNINNLGQVVGYYHISGGTGQTQAVTWNVPIRAPTDLQPGDASNKVSLKGRSVTVAVLSNPWFAAQSVDPATVSLGNEQGSDTPVIRDRRGKLSAVYRDIDGDGDKDLVLEFSTKEMIAKGDLSAAATKLVVLGRRSDGRYLRAVEPVSVVP